MRVAIPLFLLLSATPAFAAGVSVPEPSSLGLLGIGVAGVILGRYGARRRKRD